MRLESPLSCSNPHQHFATIASGASDLPYYNLMGDDVSWRWGFSSDSLRSNSWSCIQTMQDQPSRLDQKAATPNQAYCVTQLLRRIQPDAGDLERIDGCVMFGLADVSQDG
jgi:hypothetical protein